MVSKTLNTSCTTLCSKQPISLSIKIIFGLLIVIVFWVFSQWILVSLKFKGTTDWFKTYSADNYQPMIEGSTENVPYSDRISLFNMYCAYQNSFMYWLTALSVPPAIKLTIAQQQFIFSDIMQYSTHSDATSDTPGNVYGSVTPYALVESIKPTPGVGDMIFDRWCGSNEEDRRHPTFTTYTFGPAKKPSENGGKGTTELPSYQGEKFINYHTRKTVPLVLSWTPPATNSSPSSKDKDEPSWQPQLHYPAVVDELDKFMATFDDGGVNEGLRPNPYPADGDSTSWRNLFLLWLGPRWCIEAVDDNSSTFFMLNPHNYKGTDKGPGPKGTMGTLTDDFGWYGNKYSQTTYNPANFLARMNIGPQSPLFVYFCNGTYSVNGMNVDQNAFSNCLSSHGRLPGGWVGFAQGMGVNSSYDDLINYVRSRVDYQEQSMAAPSSKCTTGQKVGSGFASFFSSAIPALSMLAFIPSPFAAGYVMSAGGAVVAGALATGTLAALGDSCHPSDSVFGI